MGQDLEGMTETETKKKTVPSWCLISCKVHQIKTLVNIGISTGGDVWESYSTELHTAVGCALIFCRSGAVLECQVTDSCCDSCLKI